MKKSAYYKINNHNVATSEPNEKPVTSILFKFSISYWSMDASFALLSYNLVGFPKNPDRIPIRNSNFLIYKLLGKLTVFDKKKNDTLI